MGHTHDDDYGQRERERRRYEERMRWREAFHAYDGLDDEPADEPVDEVAYLAAEFAAGLDE